VLAQLTPTTPVIPDRRRRKEANWLMTLTGDLLVTTQNLK
jgi:hypothetical protein